MKKFLLVFLLAASVMSAAEERLLQVSETGKVKIKATRAEVHIAIEEEGKKASSVQEIVGQKMNRLVDAMKKLSPEKVETANFTVYPEYSNSNPPEIRGYRGRAEVVVLAPIDIAGTVIAEAIESGANQIQNINLRASDEEVAAAKDVALQKACEKALATAKVAFGALGLELKEVYSVVVQGSDYYPTPLRSFALSEKMNSAPSFEGDQVVQSDVTLKLRFADKQ